jgi:hypothetical protein
MACVRVLSCVCACHQVIAGLQTVGLRATAVHSNLLPPRPHIVRAAAAELADMEVQAQDLEVSGV